MGRGMGPGFTNTSSFHVVLGLSCLIGPSVAALSPTSSRRDDPFLKASLSQDLYFSSRYIHKHVILGEYASPSLTLPLGECRVYAWPSKTCSLRSNLL
jgi:hypothetical protein